MIEYNEKNIKTWSLVGSRATFGLVSLELAKKEKDLMILTSDVSTSAGLDRFRKTVNVWGDSVGAAIVETYLPAETASRNG